MESLVCTQIFPRLDLALYLSRVCYCNFQVHGGETASHQRQDAGQKLEDAEDSGAARAAREYERGPFRQQLYAEYKYVCD